MMCEMLLNLKRRREKKTYGNYGELSTYRNRITKMVLAFVIAQHTANVEFCRIIVILCRRFLHDG